MTSHSVVLRSVARPRNYWKDVENQRRFITEIGEKLGVKKIEDWYNVSRNDIMKQGGRALLMYHKDSFANALCTLFPEYKLLPWKFKTVPKGFWLDTSNHHKFMEWLSKELHIATTDDWYRVTERTIREYGGTTMIGYYQNSPAKLFESVFPEVDWKAWKRRVPSHYWKNDNNIRSFLESLSTELNVNTPQDWYNVSRRQIKEIGGKVPWKNTSEMVSKLQARYSNVTFDPKSFLQTTKKSQRWLQFVVEDLFPNQSNILLSSLNY